MTEDTSSNRIERVPEFRRVPTAALTSGPEMEPSIQLGSRESILTVLEVAMDLRCSKAHVYKAINGTVPGVSPLPAISMGRRRLIRRSTLEAWKQANEHAGADAKMILSLTNHAVDA